MRGVAVQIDMQLRAADRMRLVTAIAFEERRVFTVGDVVAQRAVARRVQHVARMVFAQPVEQRIAVGVLGGDQREVRVAAGGQRLRGAQGAHDAGGLVGVLRA
ncbi:hypothetical protein D3C71_1483490 [compost metagenome]